MVEGDEYDGLTSDQENEEDEENVVPLQKLEFWRLTVHVQGKEISVSVGDATQRVKWLAQVGIARWDEHDSQGWKRLGVPTAVRLRHKHGEDVDMNAVIREALRNGDHIYVETSLGPIETR
jgi:hypothetical protein